MTVDTETTNRSRSPREHRGVAAPSRRTVLQGAAWSVPAVTMMAASPAYALSGTFQVTVSSSGMQIAAKGSTVVTVTARDDAGQPAAGKAATLVLPSGVTATGTTDAAGIYAPTVDLADEWAKPGSTATVTAIVGSSNASAGLTVLGANALGWGQVAGMSGTDAASTVPVQMSRVFPSPIVQTRAGGSFTTAWLQVVLLADGSVWTRGLNQYGQLGDGTTTDRTDSFAKVAGVSDITQIATGQGYVMARRADGRVYTWGNNLGGQLATGDEVGRTSPVLIDLTGVAQVVAAGYTSYFLLSDGTVRACGVGGNGQIGDGVSRANSAHVKTPVAVSGISTATQISAVAGDQVGLALLADGSVKAWGANAHGAVGNGTTTDALAPVSVQGISQAVAVVGGAHTAYALLADKTVVAWGANAEGQLGNGSTTNSSVPVAVQDLTDVTRISSSWGAFHALRSDGTVYGCGWNGQGLVGDGTTTNRTKVVPVPIPAGRTVIDIGGNAGGAAVNFVLAAPDAAKLTIRTTDMQLAAKGPTVVSVVAHDDNAQPAAGQAASLTLSTGASFTGTTNAAGVFAPSVDLNDEWTTPGKRITATAVVGSASTTAQLTVVGANALGWGQQAWLAGTDTASSVPIQMARVFPSPIVQAMAGGAFTTEAFQAVLLQDGTVWTRGANSQGQLGDGTTTNRYSVFSKVPGVSDAVQISVGQGYILALRSNGSVWGWGRNSGGQLGAGDAANRSTPVQVNVTGVTQVATSANASYFLLSDGSIRSCGEGPAGQLGDGTNRSTPVLTTVQGITNATQISAVAGYPAGLAVLADGTVRAWGNNTAGGLGNGTTTHSAVPVNVSGITNAVAVVGGAHSAYALLADKTVVAWGLNAEGQLGNGSTTASSVPVAMSNLTDVTKISSSWGAFHALRSDGSVYGCGWNGQGLVGDGTTANRTTVVPITLPAGRTVTSIGANAAGAAVNFVLAP